MAAMPVCCVGCKVLDAGIYYPFPRLETDSERLKLWLKNTGQNVDLQESDARKFLVCGRHFTEDQITQSGSLKADAVPLINLNTESESFTGTGKRQVRRIFIVKAKAQNISQPGPKKDSLRSVNEVSIAQSKIQPVLYKPLNINAVLAPLVNNSYATAVESTALLKNSLNCEKVGTSIKYSDMKNLCRVCGKSNAEMLEIFEGRGLTNNLPNIITEYLPIKVSKADGKPQKVCFLCADSLWQWDELHKKCVKLECMFDAIMSKDHEQREKLEKALLMSTPLPAYVKKLRYTLGNIIQPECMKSRPVYFCKTCKYEFYEKSLLDIHFRVCCELQCYRCCSLFNSLEVNYCHQSECFPSTVCPICAKKYVGNNFINHQLICENAITTGSVTCNRCHNFSTDDLSLYEKHMSSCDSLEFIDIQLPSARNQVRKYENTANSCSFVCLCNGKFSNMDALINHSLECTAPLSKLNDLDLNKSQRKILNESKQMPHNVVFKDFARTYEDDMKDDSDDGIENMAIEIDDNRITVDEEEWTDFSIHEEHFGNLKIPLDQPLQVNNYVTINTIEEINDDVKLEVNTDKLVTECDQIQINDNPSLEVDCLTRYEKDIDNLFSLLRRTEFKVIGDFSCTICKYVGTNRMALHKHLVEQHSASRLRDFYRCWECDKPFSESQLITRHSYANHIPSECKMCHKHIDSFNQMKKHNYKEHLEGGSMEYCTVCNKTFSLSKILPHRRWHRLDELKQCDDCGKIVQGSLKFAQHMWQHRCNRRVLCPFCGKLLQYPGINIHIRTEHKGQQLKKSKRKTAGIKRPRIVCSDCGRHFHSKTRFDDHKEENLCNWERGVSLDLKKRGRCQCLFCGNSVASQMELEEHLTLHHKTEALHCKKCSIDVEDLSSLHDHLNTTHSRRRYSYVCCNTEFTNFTHVEKYCNAYHQNDCSTITRLVNGTPTLYVYNIITDEEQNGQKCTRLHCGHCSKQFKNFTCLNNHIKIVHVAIRKYKCSECDRAFTAKKYLTQHTLCHLGLKPHACRVCDQRFRHSSDRNKHERGHRLPLPPTVAGLPFREKKKRRRTDLNSEKKLRNEGNIAVSGLNQMNVGYYWRPVPEATRRFDSYL